MGKFFTEEEEKEFFAGFWTDGEERMVTIKKVPFVSQSGKNMIKLDVYDVVACVSKLDVNFDLQAALRKVDFKEDFKESITVLKVTPTKRGEREYNGNTYDEFDFTVEETGEEHEEPADVAEAAAEKVDF